MPSTLTYYIIPVKDLSLREALTVEFDTPLDEDGVDPNDLPSSRRYKINKLRYSTILPKEKMGQDALLEGDKRLQGIMSPTHNVTLPMKARETAGIPKDASTFAFIHPPNHLAKYFADIGLGAGASCYTDCKTDTEIQLCIFSLFGAFIYFDKGLIPIGINILSPLESNNKLGLDGPYLTCEQAVREATKLKRFHPVSLQISREVGIAEKAWIRPREKFQSEGAAHDHDCAHGAFIFRFDNGESLTFAISTQSPDESDLCGGLSVGNQMDLFDIASEMEKDGGFFANFEPASKILTASDDLFKLNQKIALMLDRKSVAANQIELLRNLMNKAIKYQYPLNDIEALISMLVVGQNKFADEPDKFGWTPLHYACRFQPHNDSLIAMLVEKFSGAVSMADIYNRFPLHLACDGDASIQVIELLLERFKEATRRPTLHLERLPLHFACNRGLPKEVIRALLDADETSGSARGKTKSGKLALHFALEKKDNDLIKILIEALSDTRYKHDDDKHDDDLTYRGKNPLHYACLLDVDPDIIRLILEKDCENQMTFQKIGQKNGSSFSYNSIPKLFQYEDNESETSQENDGAINGTDSYGRRDSLHSSPQISRSSSLLLTTTKGVRPLHISLANNSVKTSRLILQHEKGARITLSGRRRLAKMVNTNHQTCLHLACKSNMPPDIIRLLLDLDPSRVTTTIQDHHWHTPLHFACMHDDAREETVKMLLFAEETYLKRVKKQPGDESLRRTFLTRARTQTLRDQHEALLPDTRSISLANVNKKNPLSVAISAQAPDNILELLLKPKYFDLTGMGQSTEDELAKRVKRGMPLQRALNRTLSQRMNFMWLFYNLLINILSLVAFSMVIAPENYQPVDESQDCEDYQSEVDESQDCGEKLRMHKDGTTMLILCCVAFVIREIAQVLSQRSMYLFDVHNLADFANIIFLALLVGEASRHGENLLSNWSDSARTTFFLSGISLSTHALYTLRSIFLPFARFVRGTQAITITLIPFFITSFIVLQMFANIFMSHHRGKYSYTHATDYNKTISTCKRDDEICEACIKSEKDCVYEVLLVFFSGPAHTENLIDALFGVFVVVVLLNVVIAIVSDAWQEAKDHSTVMYWRGRIAFLSENQISSSVTPDFKTIDIFCSWIDSFVLFARDVHISWDSDYPYNLVETKEQYYSPSDYFEPHVAKQIKKAHSLHSDLQWIKSNSSEANRKEEAVTPASQTPRREMVQAYLKWAKHDAAYIFLVIFGIPTFGLLWPRDFRIWILSIGNAVEEKADTSEKR